MGKVEVKQGLFGLGKPLVKWFCDRCKIECTKEFYWSDGSTVVCRRCATRIDPDIVHGHHWDADYIVRTYKLESFFRDTNDGKERYIDQCLHCLGLVITERTDGEFQRLYYQLGSPAPRTNSFPCTAHSGYDSSGAIKIQTNCEHEFVVLATTKKEAGQAREAHKHLMTHRNLMVERMYGTDSLDLQYAAYGSTHFWCWECGLYRKLDPLREHLLPKKGLSVPVKGG